MKILFLIAPSEGKNSNINWENTSAKHENLSFDFKKPLNIATNASEKDLKCTSSRYIEWIWLNKNISKNKENLDAIYRYGWEMYKSIGYIGMSKAWKKFFEDNFIILSGMYGMLSILDKIWNYKLPIETKWLYDFWGNKIVDKLIEIKPEYIVNLLPMSYAKMAIIGKWKEEKLAKFGIKTININFLKSDGLKVSHGVKKIRWAWIKNICENKITDYKKFGWKITNMWQTINVDIKVD